MSTRQALMVIAEEDFRDEELRIPKEILEKNGVSVQVASTHAGECKGMLGMRYTPEILVENANIDESDALIIVGGSGSPAHLWNNEDVLRLVKEAYEKNRVIAAICLSGAVLANAGILKGKNATVFPTPESIKALRDGGANYLKQGVVVDGKIVTADGPRSAEKFADEILKLLK